MLFVLTITFWALIQMTMTQWQAANGFDVALLNSFASLSLLVLAVYLVIVALLKLRKA